MIIHKFFGKLCGMLESKSGHWMVGIIVVINALILGVETFKSIPEHIEIKLQHIDQIILTFFVVELVIKLLGNGLSFFRNGWNIFDLLVVGGSFVHHADFLPVLRAFRVLHLMSMVDASPKMQHILNGFWKALPGIGHVLSILLLFFYIFSVMGVFLFRDFGIVEFQHIGIAMKSMFQVLTGDDWTALMRTAEKSNKYAGIFFISFYVIMVFIILNLFIGVVVGSLQAAEEDTLQDNDVDIQPDQPTDLKKQIDRLEEKLDRLLHSART